MRVSAGSFKNKDCSLLLSLSLPEHQVLKESRVSRSLVAHVVRLSLFSLRNEKDNIDKEWGLNPC